MSSRPAAGALVALALVFAFDEGAAQAQPPSAPPAVTAPVPPAVAPAPSPRAQPKGVIVVAVSGGAGPAARALAFDVYRDPELRPSVDDATARVLAGDAAAEGAPPRLKELAELRASIVQAFAPPATPPPPTGDAGAAAAPTAPPPSDLVARRLLASLGAELGAQLVVSVALDGGRPVARTLRSSTSAFERLELGPTVDIAPDGVRTYRWPGAVGTLRGLLPAVGEAPKPAIPPGETPRPPGTTGDAPPSVPAPLAPRAEGATAPAAPVEPTPFYKSPWFWGSVGGAVAIGLSVFLISRATSTTTDVHLMGKVAP